MVDGIGFVIFLSKEVKMKRFKVMISIFFVVISLLIIMPVYSHAELVKVKGCVYNKNTGAKVLSPFVVRIWNRNGNGGAVNGVNGCYGGIELDNLSSDWDFIEVIPNNISSHRVT